jgi:hypothetical protein
MIDAMDQRTLLEGAKYRFGRAHPDSPKELIEQFRAFVRNFVQTHLIPLIDEPDFESYIQDSHYSANVKEHYRDIYRKLKDSPYVFAKTYRSFGKVERMRDGCKYKHVRCINPPPDEWKVLMGPYIHAVEKVVCRLEYFAKYIPVMARPKYIYDLFDGVPGPYWVTDYTSFESSFSPPVLWAVEGELYSHMLTNFPLVLRQLNSWNSGNHRSKFKGFVMDLPGVRMSGDPNTSLGNGFTNLMLTAFMAHRKGLDFRGLVEGDDGLFAFSGQPDFSICRQLGFELKFEPHDTVYSTSFCGLMLSRSLAAFADPRYVMAAFGWTHSMLKESSRKVRLGLLRAKAISLLYTNPRCPILTALAERFMALTKGTKVIPPRGFWDRQLFDESLRYSDLISEERQKGISDQDRLDFEALYSISVAQQKRIEEYLGQAVIGPLDHPDIASLYDDHWVYRDYDEWFCGRLSDVTGLW